MSIVIKIEWLGGHESFHSKEEGTYVHEFDPDGHGGHGDLVCTSDIKDAKRFESIADAFDFYRQQSKTHPLRHDGKPNRPLTAFTISVENYEET